MAPGRCQRDQAVRQVPAARCNHHPQGPASCATCGAPAARTGLREHCTAVRGADIVSTVTVYQSRASVLLPHLVEAGVRLTAEGCGCPGGVELHPGVARGAMTFVEYEPQTRIEGVLQQMLPERPGLGQAPALVPDLAAPKIPYGLVREKAVATGSPPPEVVFTA